MLHFINNIFPVSSCALCDERSTHRIDLCNDCISNLPVNNHCCRKCALPLQKITTSVSTTAASGVLLCGKCIATQPPFERAIVPFLYRPPIDYMIKRLKFSADLKYARITAGLVAAHIDRTLDPTELPDLLIPMPIHARRTIDRGFNQAEQIARYLRSDLALSIDRLAVTRTTELPAQSGLNARQRELNMRNAFEVNADLSGKSVAMIDDVVTTGATARSLARRLRKAGAKNISLWAIARTP